MSHYNKADPEYSNDANGRLKDNFMINLWLGKEGELYIRTNGNNLTTKSNKKMHLCTQTHESSHKPTYYPLKYYLLL